MSDARSPYRLVLLGGDLLQEISNALPLGWREAQRLEEAQNIGHRTVEHLEK